MNDILGDKQQTNGEDKWHTNVEKLSFAEQFSLNLTGTPSNLVANCTDVEFRCQLVDHNKSISDNVRPSSIWWTFRGANVSALTLPGGRVTNSNLSLSILNVDCSQFGIHNGEYNCHFANSDVETSNQISSVVSSINSSNISLDIYGKSKQYAHFGSFANMC